MSEADHKLIVSVLSPLSDKPQAIFGYNGIPFDRIENTAGSYHADAQANGDRLDPVVLEPILRRLEATYFPWVLGNRRAVAAGSNTFRFEGDGFSIDFPAGGYLEKCFAAVEECHRALPPDEKRAIDDLLRWPT
jgi:hypothetical protein